MADTVGVVIPARGGSKEIPGKNLALLGDKPLVCHAIAIARMFTDEIVVTSDSPEILAAAQKFAPSVTLHARDPMLAEDRTPLDPVIVNAATRMQSERIVTLLPTCPFVKVDSIIAALRMDWVPIVAAVRIHEVVWFDSVPFGSRENRQWLHAGTLMESGAFSVCSRTALIQSGTRYHQRPYLLEITRHEAFDIDTMEDLEIARRIHG